MFGVYNGKFGKIQFNARDPNGDKRKIDTNDRHVRHHSWKQEQSVPKRRIGRDTNYYKLDSFINFMCKPDHHRQLAVYLQ